MKRRGWLMIGGAAVLAVLMLQPAVAHEARHDYGYSYGMPMMPMPGFYGPGRGYGDHGRYNGEGIGRERYERLNLTDEQQRAMRKLMHDARSDFHRLQDKLSDQHYALHDLLDAARGGKENDAQIDKLAAGIGDLMGERIKLRAHLRIEINKLLTSEQREEARDMPFLGWDDWR